MLDVYPFMTLDIEYCIILCCKFWYHLLVKGFEVPASTLVFNFNFHISCFVDFYTSWTGLYKNNLENMSLSITCYTYILIVTFSIQYWDVRVWRKIYPYKFFVHPFLEPVQSILWYTIIISFWVSEVFLQKSQTETYVCFSQTIPSFSLPFIFSCFSTIQCNNPCLWNKYCLKLYLFFNLF